MARLSVVAALGLVYLANANFPDKLQELAGVLGSLSDTDRAVLREAAAGALHNSQTVKSQGATRTIDASPHNAWYYHPNATAIDCIWTEACDGYGEKWSPPTCEPICEIGSVHLPLWYRTGLVTQRKVSQDVPLNKLQVFGTHNSAISYAMGLGLNDQWIMKNIIWPIWNPDKYPYVWTTANQRLSLQDQLSIGVRQLEVDLHWQWDALRVCHAGGFSIPFIDNLIKDLDKWLNITITWDTETLGCFGFPDSWQGWPHERTELQALQDINGWLHNQGPGAAEPWEGRDEEVVLVMFDTHSDLEAWGKVPQLVGNVSETFGAKLFTTAEKAALFPNFSPNYENWPSKREMLEAGNRILICDDATYTGIAPWIFERSAVGNWSEFSASQFNATDCSLSGFPLGTGLMSKVLADALDYGPLQFNDEHGEDGQMVNATNLPEMLACGVTMPNVDFVVPDTLAAGMWTWADDVDQQVAHIEATAPHFTGLCPVMRPNDGRWDAVPCTTMTPTNTSMYWACRHGNSTNPAYARTTLGIERQWMAAQGGECPHGYTYSVPATPFEAAHLLRAFVSASGWSSGEAGAAAAGTASPLLALNYVPGFTPADDLW